MEKINNIWTKVEIFPTWTPEKLDGKSDGINKLLAKNHRASPETCDRKEKSADELEKPFSFSPQLQLQTMARILLPLDQQQQQQTTGPWKPNPDKTKNNNKEKENGSLKSKHEENRAIFRAHGAPRER